MFRFVAILLAAYFILAAGLQYNDPDPLHWMLLYLTSAIACVLAAIRKDSLPLLYALMGMASIEIAITANGFFTWLKAGNENLIVAKMSAEKPYIELGREFLGALISLAVAVWLWFRKR
ncbi:transmembrane 220 family protein [Leptospira semungkisensis]|nr:transmembrane 220 family protein [Leptospira semungkisensis]